MSAELEGVVTDEAVGPLLKALQITLAEHVKECVRASPEAAESISVQTPCSFVQPPQQRALCALRAPVGMFGKAE